MLFSHSPSRSSGSLGRRFRRLRLESLENRQLLAAMPLGAGQLPLGASQWDTAEYMLGRVAVVPILFESDGRIDANSENWDAASIDAAIAKIQQGVQWWSDALDSLGTAHDLEFVIDDQFARQPFQTPYELISRPSQFHSEALGSFLEDQGYGDSYSLEAAMKAFNHDARVRLNTDWAFSIVLINSANDDDGMFGPGTEFNQAFAYPGGLYVVSPSTRPVSTITHEVGHIFWARDEYPGAGSWTDRRGYYNAQNWNAANNPTPGFVQEPSIMRSGTGLNLSYQSYQLPASTMAMIGWQDSDGNGIFDVLDVPLSLTGSGFYDVASGLFSFSGHASAVALPNQNSVGHQNDITLNRVDRIEYRLDEGPWQTAWAVGQQSAELNFQIQVAAFANLQLRAIDDSVGVTSDVYQTDGVRPLLAGSSLTGWVYEQSSGSAAGVAAISPSTTRVTVSLTAADGSPLPAGQLQPSAYPSGSELSAIDGMQLVALGAVVDGRVAVLPSQAQSDRQVLAMYNRQTSRWDTAWATDRSLSVQFDQPTGQVSVTAWGLVTVGWPSYARLEAYDRDGNLITRTTSELLERGQQQTLTVHDPAGRIASIRAVGHANSVVEFGQLQYGIAATQTVVGGGAYGFSGLADGRYRVALSSQNLTYQAAVSEQMIDVSSGNPSLLSSELVRVRSPWNNPVDFSDVNVSGSTEPLDALLILTELSRGGPRVLQNPRPGERFYDTNNDGWITPLDALMVLNELSRQRRSGSGETAFLYWSQPQEKRDQTPDDEKIRLESSPIGLSPPLNR